MAAELGFFHCQEAISNALFSFTSPTFLPLSFIGNSALLLVSGLMLLSSLGSEKPSVLTVWVSVYAVHCIIRLFVLSWLIHYTRGRGRIHDDAGAADDDSDHPMSSLRIMKRIELMNVILTTIWQIIGFYWLISDGYSLWQDSPRLYWLTLVCLVCTASFIMFWSSAFLACLVLLGCLPNLAIVVRKGAPKYCQDKSSTTLANDIEKGGLFTTEQEKDSSQVMIDEEAGERSNVAKVKKMTDGGEKE